MNRDPALDTFLAEAAELLAAMEGVLLRCEQGVDNPEAINELFRAAHTIKGSAGLFGLDTIVAFTHVVEGVLDRARSGGLPITAAAAAILLECSDHIGTLVGSIAAGGSADAPTRLADPAAADARNRVLTGDRIDKTCGDSGHYHGACA